MKRVTLAFCLVMLASCVPTQQGHLSFLKEQIVLKQEEIAQKKEQIAQISGVYPAIKGSEIFARLSKTSLGYEFKSFRTTNAIFDDMVNLNIAKPTISYLNSISDFKQAYKEACINLSGSISACRDSIKNTIDKLTAIESERAHSYTKAQKFIAEYYTNTNANIVIEINDQSGLYDNSINYKDLFSLEFPRLEHEKLYVSAKYLNKFLANYKKSMSYYDKDLKRMETLNGHCNESYIGGFNLSVICPKIVGFKQEAPIKIRVTVKSKDIVNSIPKSYAVFDDVLRLNMNDGKIDFENVSKYYITIQSISFYHQDKIATLHNDISLPPESLTMQPVLLERFPLSTNRLKFHKMTKSLAEKQDMTFGFAAKYTVVDSNKAKTLYSKRKYRLIDLL